VEASLRALEELSAGGTAQCTALSRKLEQLLYEARKAFEQYDAVDARNRLAASELERRWNGKLEEIEAVKQRLSSLETERRSLSPEEETRIRSMGDHFAGVWQSNHCPPTLKKMILLSAPISCAARYAPRSTRSCAIMSSTRPRCRRDRG
jgi:hypothetical protein